MTIDPLLSEIQAAHSVRALLRTLTPEQREVAIAEMDVGLADTWTLTARDAQLPPPDLGWCWLFVGGRGTGKTHALSGGVHMAIRAGLKRLNYIAPTHKDIFEVSVTGASGILDTCGPDLRPRWVPSKRRLEWPNGAICSFFSGEEPDSLRGPQCEIAFVDELARMPYGKDVFDMGMMGLRLGHMPRMFIATTPRPTPLMKSLIKADGIAITRGSTWDNAAHLAPSFLTKIRELYEGTRLGRQELEGTLLLDPPNALFKNEWLQCQDVPEDEVEQVTVGVDPSGGEDLTGIVVAALLNGGKYAVLADRSMEGTPAQWGDQVVRSYDEFRADDVVVEVNFGGAMASEVVRQAADRAFTEGRRPDNMIRIREVNASRGKAMRAEPISLLYEKGRVLHSHGLVKLEEEMLAFSREWNRAVDGSPNRLDAAVWGLTRLSGVKLDIPFA